MVPVNNKFFHLYHLKPQRIPKVKKMFYTSAAVAAEAMIVTNNQYFGSDFLRNQLNELFRRKFRKFPGKRNFDQVRYARFCKGDAFFLTGTEQINVLP